jgi:AcrR family transcriptional regulator
MAGFVSQPWRDILTPMPSLSAASAKRTSKFAQRRAAILDIASDLINLHGARGMTLTGVAKALGIDTSSVTYYFKRKDDLTAACLERTLTWQHDAAQTAAAEPDEQTRVRRFLHEHFALHRSQRDPAVHRLALLSDMRSLHDEVREPLDAMYADTFRIVRGFFDAGDAPGARSQSLLAAVILMANIHWLPAWQERYLASDLDRVEQRLFDVIAWGLEGTAAWPLETDPLEEDDPGNAQSRFLHAATNTINREGYIGASVEKIAGELGVSIGSFYYHLDNKDDLVIACFRRSFALVKRAQAAAEAHGGTQGEQLGRTIASLIVLQFSGDSPMLRTSAYQALPLELREQMLRRTMQVTSHVGGTIADGIAENSLRPVDPVIAAEAVMAAVNAAPDLRRWASARPLDQAVATFVHTLRRGIFG